MPYETVWVKGVPTKRPVPFWSDRSEHRMGHQLYLGPMTWILFGGSMHRFWLTFGPLSVSWQKRNKKFTAFGKLRKNWKEDDG